jgi:hypothetical protein
MLRLLLERVLRRRQCEKRLRSLEQVEGERLGAASRHAGNAFQIIDQGADQERQVGRGPVALHEALAEPDFPLQQDTGEKAHPVNMDLRTGLVTGGVPECVAGSIRQAEAEWGLIGPAQDRDDHLHGEPVEPGRLLRRSDLGR